jgi:hypothetical protein
MTRRYWRPREGRRYADTETLDMRKPDWTPGADEALEQAAGWQEAAVWTNAVSPIVYSRPAAADTAPLYTLSPRAAARRHAQCLHRCVIGMWRKFG